VLRERSSMASESPQLPDAASDGKFGERT